jgi:putative transposase
MMTSVQTLSEQANIPLKWACAALNVPRSSFYRHRQPPAPLQGPKQASPRALSATERDQIAQTLNSERFADQSPYQVYATLLDDEQTYLCSISTMYRILRQNVQLRERRNQRQHPNYTKPELLATGPNQLWSWDIAKLRGPQIWQYYQLYVILDVFSRFVVAWRIEERESDRLAEELIAEACFQQNIAPHQLTLHADRGSAMISKTVAQLLLDLQVAKTHSRPHTSNDNPYSEAQFKTLKYRPGYPDRFGSVQDARQWASSFFDWYNHQHRHSGLALMTPVAVHTGQADQLTAQRQITLELAQQHHPERFVRGTPQPAPLPDAVWINKPEQS